jgi:hypothetical protein
MVPPGEADFLVVGARPVEVNRGQLRAGGVLIGPDTVDPANKLPTRRASTWRCSAR